MAIQNTALRGFTHWAPRTTAPIAERASVCGVLIFSGGEFGRGVNYAEYDSSLATCPHCRERLIRSNSMQRYTATITRLNSTAFEIHINAESIEQATHIAADMCLLRDGETLVVELTTHG